jgi:DNA-binding response OmpR family regulator
MAVPVNINQSLSMARTSLQPATQDTRVLLLVEDNPGDAQLVSELLSEQQRERFQIIHVPAVAAAVHTLQSTPIDVIVLDLGLPDGSGVDVVKAMREVAADVPIVVLTGLEDEDVALACIEAGAQDYLPKSEVRAQNLKRAIGYAVSRMREAQMRDLEQTLAYYRSMSSATHSTSVTAALAGSGSVSLRSPAAYSVIVEAYFALLTPFLERKSDQVTAPREAMEIIITTLGDAAGGPRDLLEVHVAALDRALSLFDDPHSRTIVFEARLLALEMMGLLVDYYRVGHRRRNKQGLSS